MGHSIMQTVIFMKANGKTTRLMVKVFIIMLMELIITVIGRMISNMGSEQRDGLMALYIKDFTMKGKRTVEEN
jgi:hypothetical protein